MCMLIRALGFLCLMLLCSCATMNESECRNADWKIIGLEDGSRGKELSHIAQHRKACTRYNIVPNLQQYQYGYKLGLQNFCTPAKGFQIGQRGGTYTGICPQELEQGFLAGYQQGREIAILRDKIKHIKSVITAKEEDFNKLNKMIINKEKLIISSETSELRRAKLLDDIKEIQVDIDDLETEIWSLKKKKTVKIHKLKYLIAQSPF